MVNYLDVNLKFIFGIF